MYLLAATVIWCIYHLLSRLVFHPLSVFSGPKMAALTSWYVAYWETIRDGMLVKQLEQLHQIYGEVVQSRRMNCLKLCNCRSSGPNSPQ